jgi:glycosyltransferase involved in cell wall biosynthesis
MMPPRDGLEAPARICVLIPVWNNQEGLLRTLEALVQDEAPYDILVVDDGSHPPVICAEQYGSHRTTILRLSENQGIENALNAGLEHILGRGTSYVARLDASDLPVPGRIAKQAEFLDHHPDTGIVGTWARCVDESRQYLFTLRFPADHRGIMRKQRYAPGLLHPSVMIRVDALREVGLYSTRYRTAEDFELFWRVGLRWRLANIPEALTEYTIEQHGTTVSKRRRNLVARLRVQAAHFTWHDSHAYLGLLRSLIFLAVPFSAIRAAKARLWK